MGSGRYELLVASTRRTQRSSIRPDKCHVADVRYFLCEAEPNPAGRRTRIRYHLATPGPIQLTLYNAPGERICGLAGGQQSAGHHEALVADLAAGTYSVLLTAGAFRAARRLIIQA